MKNISVVGVGGIGGYIAARLFTAKSRRENQDMKLSLIVRGAHLEAIRKAGLTFFSPSGEKTLCRPDAATDKPADLPVQDLIVLCVKGYGLDGACESIRPLIGPSTVIIPLLNGIDIYDRARKILKKGIILPACIYISSTLEDAGIVRQTGGKGNIIAGLDPAFPAFSPEPLIRLFSDAGIPFDWQADPAKALWTKYLFIAAYGLVTAVSGKPIGAVLEDPFLVETMKSILAEIAALAQAKKAGLSEKAADEAVSKGAAFPYDTKTSFQRDVESAGKPNEGDLFGGTIIMMGKELGIPTPVSEKTYRKILAMTA